MMMMIDEKSTKMNPYTICWSQIITIIIIININILLEALKYAIKDKYTKKCILRGTDLKHSFSFCCLFQNLKLNQTFLN